MDKKKIISSLTLAGMLATTVAGSGVFAAETSDPATKALGEYSKLITGKVAVPFILQSKTDRVTGKDVKASFKNASTFTFNSTALTDDQVLATGDVVYINGEARTIIIYGDVNGDGEINIRDAVAILSHVNKKKTLDSVAFAAADLDNDGVLSVREAVGVLSRINSKKPYESIATAPVAPVSVIKHVIISNEHTIGLVFDNTVEGYTYKLTDKNGENVECTSINQDATATITTTLVPEEEYTLTVYDKELNEIATKTIVYRELKAPTPTEATYAINDENVKNFSMILKLNSTDANEVATNVTVSLVSSDDTTVAEASTTLPANTVSTSVNFSDLSKVEDGSYTIVIMVTDANGNVTYSTPGVTVTKASTAPVVYVDAVRNSSDFAEITVNANVEDLTYYAMSKATGEKAPTVSELKEDGTEIDGSGVTTTTAVIPVTEVAQTIYVVAVNEQGTASNIATTEIANHGVATLASVTAITLNDTEYTWTDSNTEGVKGYQVRVLKSTEVVAETTVTEAKYDIAKVAKENGKAGDKFKISVKALGDNKEYANSDVVVAEDTISTNNNLYEVPAIAKVTGVTLDNNAKLTWNTAGITEAKSLTIKLYKAFAAENVAGYEYKEVKAIENVNKSTYEYDLKDVIAKEGVGVYTATVTAIANTDSIKLDSEESADVVTDPSTITQKYVVAVAPTDVTMKVNNTTVTARFSPIDIPGTGAVEYKVKVEKKVNGEYEEDSITQMVPTTAIDENDKVEVEITSLDNATDYRITIIATFVDGTEVETKAQEISTPAEAIADATYTVVALADEDDTPTSGEVGITPKGVMKVNDDSKDFTEAPNYEDIKAVVSKLNAGDEITVVDGKVSAIEVTADGTKSRTLDLGKVSEEATLTINGNDTYYINVLGTVNSVELSDTEDAKYDLSGLTVAETVTLNANEKAIKVANGTIVEFAGGDVVTLNGMLINTTGKVKVEGNTLTVLEANKTLTIDSSNVVIKTAKVAEETTKIDITDSTVDITEAILSNDSNAITVNGEISIITVDTLVGNDAKITPLNNSKMTLKLSDAENTTTVIGNVKVEYVDTNLSSIDSTKFTGVSFGDRTLEGQPGINATYSVDENGVLTVEMTSGTIVVKERTATVSKANGIKIDVPAGVATEKVKLELSNLDASDVTYADGKLIVASENTSALVPENTLTVDWGNGLVETFTVAD